MGSQGSVDLSQSERLVHCAGLGVLLLSHSVPFDSIRHYLPLFDFRLASLTVLTPARPSPGCVRLHCLFLPVSLSCPVCIGRFRFNTYFSSYTHGLSSHYSWAMVPSNSPGFAQGWIHSTQNIPIFLHTILYTGYMFPFPYILLFPPSWLSSLWID